MLLVAAIPAPALAVDPWPGEPAAEAVNPTFIEGPEPNEFHLDARDRLLN